MKVGFKSSLYLLILLNKQLAFSSFHWIWQEKKGEWKSVKPHVAMSLTGSLSFLPILHWPEQVTYPSPASVDIRFLSGGNKML